MAVIANVPLKIGGVIIRSGEELSDDALKKLGDDGLNHVLQSGRCSKKETAKAKTSSKKKATKKSKDLEE